MKSPHFIAMSLLFGLIFSIITYLLKLVFQ